MSYVPKYILKRMLTKDSIKAVENGVEVSFLNVISPIAIEELPNEDLLGYIEVKMDEKALDKEALATIKFSMEGKDYSMENIHDLIGETIPVGGKIQIFLPFADAKAGEEREFDITIKTDNPFNIKVKRVIQ